MEIQRKIHYTKNLRSSDWYAVYVRSRAEKKVAKLLEEQGIKVYLPLVKDLKEWSDRRKWIQVPLFRSYLFIKISLKDYSKVIKTDGVSHIVSFEGKPVKIPEPQIEAIERFIKNGDVLVDNPDDYTIGCKVRIIHGSMKGLEGTLVEHRGKQKVKIQIEGINKTLFINIPLGYLIKFSNE